MRVLSRLFRRLLLEKLCAAHQAGELKFFGEHTALCDAKTFSDWLAPMRQREWVVYAKAPFAGPAAVLAYLSRYTHRVAIANSRLIALDDQGVTFTYKDYRAKGRCRHKRMSLPVEEFMRRFLLHVLPRGLHRIRHCGLLANAARMDNLARARECLATDTPQDSPDPCVASEEPSENETPTRLPPCPCCGGRMLIIERFEHDHAPRAPPPLTGEAA